MSYPNAQSNPASATPVWIASSGSFPGQRYIGYELLDLSDGAAHGLTVPVGATFAVVMPESANVRWLIGADPTASNGMPIWATSEKSFGANLATLKFIRMSGTTSKLNIAYYGVA